MSKRARRRRSGRAKGWRRIQIEVDETKCCDCGVCVVNKATVRTHKGNRLVKVVCRDCDIAERVRYYVATGHIDTWLSMEAMLADRTADPTGTPFQRINASGEAIKRAAKRFEASVWFGGLKEIVKACDVQGMKAAPLTTRFGEVTPMLWACAGRVMFTLDAPKCDVTTITTDEDGNESRMGVQGLHATEAQAVAMLDAVTTAWKAGTVKFAPDRNVGL